MTDINGVPVITPTTPEQPQGTVIARVPVTLEANHDTFEVSLREPGIVRACAFWLREPNVLASAVRRIDPVPQPLLFVECNTDGEIRRRRFVFAPSEGILPRRPGLKAQYVATASMLMQNGLMTGHLFEIVEATS